MGRETDRVCPVTICEYDAERLKVCCVLRKPLALMQLLDAVRGEVRQRPLSCGPPMT